jgi:hypothetical protein
MSSTKRLGIGRAGAGAPAPRATGAGPGPMGLDEATPPGAPGAVPLYEPPRVEPLGHWQVHTMDTYSIDILP